MRHIPWLTMCLTRDAQGSRCTSKAVQMACMGLGTYKPKQGLQRLELTVSLRNFKCLFEATIWLTNSYEP